MTWTLVAAAVLLLIVNLVAAQLYCTTTEPYNTDGDAVEINLVPTSFEAIRARYDAITNAAVPNGDRARQGE